jgi:hypothetical protein
MRYVHLAIIIIFCSVFTARAATQAGMSDTLKLGARPFYGLVLGDYGSSYSNSPGFMISAQGAFQVNADNRLLLYPEFCWGFYYIAHRTESSRRLLLFPFSVNMIFDIKALTFYPKDSSLSLKPYVGVGLYLDDYQSGRKSAIAGDFGYQAGIILEFTHAKMERAYIEARINHAGVTNFVHYMPTLDFSVGAGYPIELKTGTDGGAGARSKDSGDSKTKRIKMKIE